MVKYTKKLKKTRKKYKGGMEASSSSSSVENGNLESSNLSVETSIFSKRFSSDSCYQTSIVALCYRLVMLRDIRESLNYAGKSISDEDMLNIDHAIFRDITGIMANAEFARGRIRDTGATADHLQKVTTQKGAPTAMGFTLNTGRSKYNWMHTKLKTPNNDGKQAADFTSDITKLSKKEMSTEQLPTFFFPDMELKDPKYTVFELTPNSKPEKAYLRKGLFVIGIRDFIYSTFQSLFEGIKISTVTIDIRNDTKLHGYDNGHTKGPAMSGARLGAVILADKIRRTNSYVDELLSSWGHTDIKAASMMQEGLRSPDKSGLLIDLQESVSCLPIDKKLNVGDPLFLVDINGKKFVFQVKGDCAVFFDTLAVQMFASVYLETKDDPTEAIEKPLKKILQSTGGDILVPSLMGRFGSKLIFDDKLGPLKDIEAVVERKGPGSVPLLINEKYIYENSKVECLEFTLSLLEYIKNEENLRTKKPELFRVIDVRYSNLVDELSKMTKHYHDVRTELYRGWYRAVDFNHVEKLQMFGRITLKLIELNRSIVKLYEHDLDEIMKKYSNPSAEELEAFIAKSLHADIDKLRIRKKLYEQLRITSNSTEEEGEEEGEEEREEEGREEGEEEREGVREEGEEEREGVREEEGEEGPTVEEAAIILQGNKIIEFIKKPRGKAKGVVTSQLQIDCKTNTPSNLIKFSNARKILEILKSLPPNEFDRLLHEVGLKKITRGFLINVDRSTTLKFTDGTLRNFCKSFFYSNEDQPKLYDFNKANPRMLCILVLTQTNKKDTLSEHLHQLLLKKHTNQINLLRKNGIESRFYTQNSLSAKVKSIQAVSTNLSIKAEDIKNSLDCLFEVIREYFFKRNREPRQNAAGGGKQKTLSIVVSNQQTSPNSGIFAPNTLVNSIIQPNTVYRLKSSRDRAIYIVGLSSNINSKQYAECIIGTIVKDTFKSSQKSVESIELSEIEQNYEFIGEKSSSPPSNAKFAQASSAILHGASSAKSPQENIRPDKNKIYRLRGDTPDAIYILDIEPSVNGKQYVKYIKGTIVQQSSQLIFQPIEEEQEQEPIELSEIEKRYLYMGVGKEDSSTAKHHILIQGTNAKLLRASSAKLLRASSANLSLASSANLSPASIASLSPASNPKLLRASSAKRPQANNNKSKPKPKPKTKRKRKRMSRKDMITALDKRTKTIPTLSKEDFIQALLNNNEGLFCKSADPHWKELWDIILDDYTSEDGKLFNDFKTNNGKINLESLKKDMGFYFDYLDKDLSGLITLEEVIKYIEEDTEAEEEAEAAKGMNSATN